MTWMPVWFFAATLVAIAPAAAECPALTNDARRLLLVTSPDMSSVKATLRRFERAEPGQPWRELAHTSPAVVGSTGLGWAAGEAGALAGEPHKHEGDKRTPAGLFRLGSPFGKDPSTLANYLRLAPDQDICVDDPASPHYGQIIARHDDPTIHGEDMGRVSLYRRGFLIDYPVNASQRSGSCIFLHVWRQADKGTVGCVASPEPVVATLQGWARTGDVIAILPERESGKLLACLAVSPTTP